MTDSRTHSKVLLVEGNTEKRVIPYLMEKNDIVWKTDDQPVVCIKPCGGIENILKREGLRVELKASKLGTLGVLVDANGNAHERWNQIRHRCREEFGDSSGEQVDLPEEIPKDGLDIVLPNDIRFGIWIMPDNRFEGMLETFLVQLIPHDARDLYEHARNCVEKAKQLDAPFRDVHTTKAQIHTWLAWQDEPGKQLHEAVNHQVLDPKMPHSESFVNWFRRLFEV